MLEPHRHPLELPQSMLERLKTVDGRTSGLDADLLDGLQATDFQLARKIAIGPLGDTAYTVQRSWDDAAVWFNNGSQVTITVPADYQVTTGPGFRTWFFAAGAGGLVITGDSAVTFPGSPSLGIVQGEGIYIEHTAMASTWLCVGGTQLA